MNPTCPDHTKMGKGVLGKEEFNQLGDFLGGMLGSFAF